MTRVSRVVTWTATGGVQWVSADMPHDEAESIASRIRENPGDLLVRVEDAVTGAQDALNALFGGLGL